MRKTPILITAVASLLIALAPAGPASAAGSGQASCTTFHETYPAGNCVTAPVPAGDYHMVQWAVAPNGPLGPAPCGWTVRDIDTWVVVGRGIAYDSDVGYIGGLYGWYRLELTRCFYNSTGWLSSV
jgi:hypothetical protein